MRNEVKYLSYKTGLAPGELVHVGKKREGPVKVNLIRFNEQEIQEYEIKSIQDIPQPDPNYVTWLNVDGLHDIKLIEAIGERFNLHILLVEDLLNTLQRPKVDFSEDYFYIVFKTIEFDKELSQIMVEQISVFVGTNYLLSFQEFPGDLFDGIREKIRQNKSRIRKKQADYLAYAILDITIDHYFDILETLHEKIDLLQQQILIKTDLNLPKLIYHLRQQTLLLRKISWPLRQIIDQVYKSESTLISNDLGPYLRDILDHILRVSEAIDSIQSTLDNSIEMHLSLTSQKTNETMRFLTVVTTILMPPALLSGIYGMNFVHMPGIEWKLGFYVALGVMFASSVLMLMSFNKKG